MSYIFDFSAAIQIYLVHLINIIFYYHQNIFLVIVLLTLVAALVISFFYYIIIRIPIFFDFVAQKIRILSLILGK